MGIAEASALKALLEGGMTFLEVKRAVRYKREEEREEFALASPLLPGTELSRLPWRSAIAGG